MTKRIIELANQLIEEVQKEGYPIVNEYPREDGTILNHGIVEIRLYEHIKDAVFIGNVCGKWEIRGDLSAKVWEVEHD